MFRGSQQLEKIRKYIFPSIFSYFELERVKYDPKSRLNKDTKSTGADCAQRVKLAKAENITAESKPAGDTIRRSTFNDVILGD